MQLGISTASLFGLVATENTFDIFRQQGVKVCEVFLSTLSEYKQDFVNGIVSNLQGVSVHSVHSLGMQYEGELFVNHDRVKSDAYDMFGLVCNAARLLNAKFVNFHGPLKLKRQPYNYNYDNLARTINNLCEVASQYNLGLSYENIHYGFFDNPSYFATLAKHCPNLYATVDIKQAVQSGIDPIEYFDAVGDRLGTVHICDVGIDNVPCLPFDGQVNFENIFNYLVQKKITAPIILELYPSNYKDGINNLINIYHKVDQMLQGTVGNVVKYIKNQ